MDTLTHGLIGRLGARTIWPEKSNLVNLVTICSVLPDLDVLIPGSGLEYLRDHRGISHSLIGAIAGAGIIAGITQRIGLKSEPFGRIYTACLFGLLIHIFFDVITTFGTLIFAPFSTYRASIDLLFIIDPYLDILLIGGLLAGWRIGRRGYRWGAALTCGYVVLAALITGIGHGQVRTWANEQGVHIDQIDVMPMPFSPLHRRGLIVSNHRVYWIPVSLFHGVYGDPAIYADARSDDRLKAVWSMQGSDIYAWFARVPVVLEVENHALLVQDLQFVIRREGLGWLGAWVAELAMRHYPQIFDRRNFSLLVERDADGYIHRVYYLDQNGAKHPL